ncbi:MAG: hypothetical protein ACYCS9_04515 [Candidatus Dormibacteria bacterium]
MDGFCPVAEDLAARHWDRDRIDREVMARYRRDLAALALDEGWTQDMFDATAE